MNGLIAWWARNSVAANLLMAAIFVGGFLAYLNVEKEVFPTFEVDVVQISVAWPGASPRDVEEQLVVRIEESLDGIDAIDLIRSTAAEGVGTVIAEAKAGTDVDDFVNEIKRKVDAIATLPTAAEPPIVQAFEANNEVFSIAVSGDVGERKLKAYAENIRDDLLALSSISRVDLFGVRAEEVSIEVSEESMRRFGITFDNVVQAVRGTSVNRSSGTVRTGNGQVQVRARNLADTQEEFEAIIVRQNADGGTVRVGDVATVIDGFEDEEILATLNGKPAVLVQVMSQEEMDVVQMAKEAKAYIKEKSETLPTGVKLEIWQDLSKIYFQRMELIGGSAIAGLALVFLVLILTLRPKVAIWVTIGIATAFAGTFVFLPTADVSLNMLSLFSFLLVIGVVVDDAIVVGESIHRISEEEGGGSADTATKATQLVAKPVIFAVLTTIITFMPFMFLEGNERNITRMIALVVMLSLVFSLIEALFILPNHLSKLKPKTKLNAFDRFQKRIADAIKNFANTQYRSTIQWSLRNRYVTSAAFGAAFIVSVGLVATGWVKQSFFPEVESDRINVWINMPPGSTWERAQQILTQMQRANDQLAAEISEQYAGTGKRVIEGTYARIRRENMLASVQVAPPEELAIPIEDAAKRLRELIGEIPDAKSVELYYTLNNNGPDITFAFSHPDTDTLQEVAGRVKSRLAQFEAAYDIQDDLSGSVEEIRVSMLPGAERLGLTLGEVSRQLRQAYFGEEVQRLPREGNDVRVMVRYPTQSRRTLDSLAEFRVRTSEGTQIPLSAVATFEYAPGVTEIERREKRRTTQVSAYLSDSISADIRKIMNDEVFPELKDEFPDLRVGETGAGEGQQQFLTQLLTLLTVALLVNYALVAIAFQNYWMPFLVMSAIPYGFMGAVVGHMVFGMPLALFSYIGLAAAAGVVVNDNIVLLDHVERLRKEKGYGAMQALVEGGVDRFRPIVLTSLTTFIGLLPMMADRSTQAQFLQPTIITLSFGVALATGVTLILVPALYGIGTDINRRVRSMFGGKPVEALGSHMPSEAAGTPAE